jgi:carbamoyltransferase
LDQRKAFLKKLIHDGLSNIESYNKSKLILLFPEHHISHAGSAFFTSPFVESAVLTIDGVGEWATASICHGKGNTIKMLKEMRFPHSLGLLYSAFTYYLGFRVNSGEYKLMGLAPYGNKDALQTQNLIKTIKEHLVSIKSDGSIWLNQAYFTYATGNRMLNTKRWEKLLGLPPVTKESTYTQAHCNLAYAIQHITEEIVLKMAIEAKRLTGSKYLCLAGGVALNCVSNGKLLREKIFDEIYIQPAAGDAGGALGAALTANYMYFQQSRNPSKDTMKASYLGPEYSEKEILTTLKKHKAVYTKGKP